MLLLLLSTTPCLRSVASNLDTINIIIIFFQVPRVFINGASVGGCDDTVALDNKGELGAKLK